MGVVFVRLPVILIRLLPELPLGRKTLFARLPPEVFLEFPLIVGSPERLKVPSINTPPPESDTVQPVIVPPERLKVPTANTPPPFSAELSEIFPPFMVKVPP